MCVILGKYSLKNIYDKPVRKEYRKLQVDPMPVVDSLEKLNYVELLKEYLAKHGKPLKPIKRHKNSLTVSDKVACPRCGAPHFYIYRNNGKSKSVQYLCKVCDFTFGSSTDYLKNTALRCPYCNKALVKVKKRKHFNIFKCKNKECSFYLSNLKSLTPQERKRYTEDPQAFKLYYIYREFTISLKPLSKKSPVMPDVDLSKIHSSPHILGLILSYYVNYGMSSRTVASIMQDIYSIKISHQSVINYANAAAMLLKPFVDNYKYPLTNSICGDETYIKVNGSGTMFSSSLTPLKKLLPLTMFHPTEILLRPLKLLMILCPSMTKSLKILTLPLMVILFTFLHSISLQAMVFTLM